MKTIVLWVRALIISVRTFFIYNFTADGRRCRREFREAMSPESLKRARERMKKSFDDKHRTGRLNIQHGTVLDDEILENLSREP